ncbi:hypothetical protein HPB50_018772 [Hyalomma asiaticum]|uniref:Uncharacterized protein n=1 Tax=Hyalomma asiaticum TaxID=266040 RepID=A0ACB7S3R7_HYAAI|nr:hypothetical protein HPB50_018772 [Hyalomma asiaticum]
MDTVVSFLRKNDLRLAVADKEGGFVLMTKGHFDLKAAKAVEKNFRRVQIGDRPNAYQVGWAPDKGRFGLMSIANTGGQTWVGYEDPNHPGFSAGYYYVFFYFKDSMTLHGFINNLHIASDNANPYEVNWASAYILFGQPGYHDAETLEVHWVAWNSIQEKGLNPSRTLKDKLFVRDPNGKGVVNDTEVTTAAVTEDDAAGAKTASYADGAEGAKSEPETSPIIKDTATPARKAAGKAADTTPEATADMLRMRVSTTRVTDVKARFRKRGKVAYVESVTTTPGARFLGPGKEAADGCEIAITGGGGITGQSNVNGKGRIGGVRSGGNEGDIITVGIGGGRTHGPHRRQ